MIKICSFFSLPRVDQRIGKVYSIANSSPFAVDGCIRCLTPTWNMVRQYKLARDEEAYTVKYRELVRDRWPAIKKWMDSIEVNDEIYLCCWEKTGFCHRYLVAKLLKHYRSDLKVRVS